MCVSGNLRLPRCYGRSLSSVRATSATEKPIFSSSYMNWPSIPVQAMHAQHWPTHYTPQSLTLSLTLTSPLSQTSSLLFIISPSHHYPHCALPTVLHPSFVLPARSIILSILPFRPPGFSFLVWPGITPQTVSEWDDSVCFSLCTLSEFRVCVERKRRRRKRQWVKDVSQVPAYPYPSSLAGSLQCQGP